MVHAQLSSTQDQESESNLMAEPQNYVTIENTGKTILLIQLPSGMTITIDPEETQQIYGCWASELRILGADNNLASYTIQETPYYIPE